MSGPLPYLSVSGVEVANAARTLAYLRAGLAAGSQGHWELGTGSLCSVLSRPDGVPLSYVSPAADPAPWYDPDEPGAASFLGLVLLDLDGYAATSSRSVTNRLAGLGGGSFGGQRRNPRTWKFRAAMVSADDAGAEYGLRWLTSALQASVCDSCALGSLAVRLVCPPDDGSDDGRGFWASYDVALTDGPNEVEKWSPRTAEFADLLAGCRDLVVVEFTLTAGNPFLYRAPSLQSQFTLSQQVECTDICSFLFGSPGDSHCVTVTPPKRGVLGSVFALHSAGGFGGLVIEGWQACPGAFEAVPRLRTPRRGRPLSRPYARQRRRLVESATPVSTVALMQQRHRQQLSSRLGTPAVIEPLPAPLRLELASVPAGATLVVDSAQHKIYTVADNSADRADASGLVVLDADKSIQWLEVRDCDEIGCFCIRAAQPCSSGIVDVSVYTQAREG